MLDDLVDLHDRFFKTLEAALDGWFLGFFARFVFAAVLLVYFWNAALTKLGSGLFGIVQLSPGAYMQILPGAMEAVGYSPSALSLHHHLIVYAGTYAEFILPALIVLGLFTRLAALGMIVFVAVQSYVDIAFHGADERTIGALFDRFPDAAILDQRTLWLVPLVYLIAKGAGAISLDHVLARRFKDPLDEPLPAFR
jgi:putative oxidoreductase